MRRATTARGDDNGDAMPTSTVALAVTQHTTRREVTGGGRTSGEAGGGGRRSSGRACTRTRGFRKCAKSIRLEIGCLSTVARLFSLTRQVCFIDLKVLTSDKEIWFTDPRSKSC